MDSGKSNTSESIHYNTAVSSASVNVTEEEIETPSQNQHSRSVKSNNDIPVSDDNNSRNSTGVTEEQSDGDDDLSTFHISDATAITLAREILTLCNRTESGGDTYFCINSMLIAPIRDNDLCILTPFSAECDPMEVTISIVDARIYKKKILRRMSDLDGSLKQTKKTNNKMDIGSTVSGVFNRHKYDKYKKVVGDDTLDDNNSVFSDSVDHDQHQHKRYRDIFNKGIGARTTSRSDAPRPYFHRSRAPYPGGGDRDRDGLSSSLHGPARSPSSAGGPSPPNNTASSPQAGTKSANYSQESDLITAHRSISHDRLTAAFNDPEDTSSGDYLEMRFVV